MFNCSEAHGKAASKSDSGFDVEKAVIACNENIKKGTTKSIKVIVFVLFVSLAVGDLLRVWGGQTSLLYNDPIGFVTLMFVPIIFGLYLYMVELSDFKRQVGSEVFIKYTQNLMSKEGNVSRLDGLHPKELIAELAKLEGNTYGQLSAPLKELVVYSAAKKYYAPSWLLSNQTLENMATAKNNYSFHKIINESDKVISVKGKFIERKIKALKQRF